MTLQVRAYANADDVLLAWRPDTWDDAWIGFRIDRRNDATQAVTTLPNRIPPQPGGPPTPEAGISSALSPFRRCLWTDHALPAGSRISYRVTPMTAAADNTFAPDDRAASAWTDPVRVSGDAGEGLSAVFNRGTIMSQVVSRFVGGDVTSASLHAFAATLAIPGTPARRYLSGDARLRILAFLANADQQGSEIHAALYEINDPELIDALKPFGPRGHVLIGNGDSTAPTAATDLAASGLDIHHRDLSKSGKSSPSVHNKFVVETDRTGAPLRTLTGSTNWTTTGLCTQLNNVLVLDRPAIAARYLDQWQKLVAAGDDMPRALRAANGTPTTDTDVSLYFAATTRMAEFAPVLDLIAKARTGAVFLMFTPGQSPLLDALLTRARENAIYVRGVVSQVMPSGGITRVGGQVVKSGVPPAEFHDDILVPANIAAAQRPAWAETEFNAGQMRNEHMLAIVHSKVIVIDPFSPDCAVVTGSHNFSASASQHNDENLVVIRGNQALAQAYALHVNGVYDHYAWRSYLTQGGDPARIYQPLDAWHQGGNRTQELAFWMGS